jgi:hypothetical protein
MSPLEGIGAQVRQLREAKRHWRVVPHVAESQARSEQQHLAWARAVEKQSTAPKTASREDSYADPLPSRYAGLSDRFD